MPAHLSLSGSGADTDVIQSLTTEGWTGQNQGQGMSQHIVTFPAHAHPVRFRIKIHFKDSKGTLIKTVEANEGDDILSIAHEYDIDLEGTSVFVDPSQTFPLPCLRSAMVNFCTQRRMRGFCSVFNMSCHPRLPVL